MIPFNWMAIPVAALVPFVTGFIWYHPKVFGTKWMQLSGVTDNDIKNSNMPKIFGLSFVFNVLIAAALISVVIHQMHVLAIMTEDPNFGQEGAESTLFLQNFLSKYGGDFRSFGHGALHGAMTGLFLIFPTMSINNMYERRKFGLNFIHGFYWIVTMAIMGGIICVWTP